MMCMLNMFSKHFVILIQEQLQPFSILTLLIYLVTFITCRKQVVTLEVKIDVFSDNQVYSWGLNENGRLGVISDQGKGPGGSQCIALPKPIFGSLHRVSNISCHHWHACMVAGGYCVQKSIFLYVLLSLYIFANIYYAECSVK